MATEVEVLRSQVVTLQHQLSVLRSAFSSRNDVLHNLQRGLSGTSLPGEGWVREMVKALKEQESRELACANMGEEPTPPPPPPILTTVANEPRKAPPPKKQASKPAGGDSGDLAASCAETLLGVSGRLVGMWQEALHEMYGGVLKEILNAFVDFDAQPSDGTLQCLLRKMKALQPEMTQLVQRLDDFIGAGGNPFNSASDDAADLTALYKDEIGKVVERALEARAPEEKSRVDEVVAKARQAEGELRKELERAQQQVATLQAEKAEAAKVVRYSHSSSPEPPRPPSRPPQPQPEAQPSPQEPPPDPSRVAALQASMAYLEAQLAAQCNGRTGSEQRFTHLRRRLESTRKALEEEERRLGIRSRPGTPCYR